VKSTSAYSNYFYVYIFAVRIIIVHPYSLVQLILQKISYLLSSQTAILCRN